MIPLTKDCGFDEVVRLFIKEGTRDEARLRNGSLLPPICLYEEQDILRMNRNDYKEQIEDDLNAVSNKLGWVIKVKVHKVASGMNPRYDYVCYFVPLLAMVQDELIDVIRFC